jgi:hypothetical protein
VSQEIVSRLAELEAVVERGLETFVEVGTALQEIRDAKLYKVSHSTFEAYCKERWHFSASRARQLCAAAKTAKALPAVTVTSERHARQLARASRPQPSPEQAAAQKLVEKALGCTFVDVKIDDDAATEDLIRTFEIVGKAYADLTDLVNAANALLRFVDEHEGPFERDELLEELVDLRAAAEDADRESLLRLDRDLAARVLATDRPKGSR